MLVDLNADLGESFGNYTCGMDRELLPAISSANVACGFHASDPLVMAQTVQMAAGLKVAVGAHPGYPDLVGFGRRNMSVSPAELKAMVQYQIGALNAFCLEHGLKLQHVKPHGAMYNMAGKDPVLADAIAEAIAAVDSSLILLGLSGSQMLLAGERHGLRCACEVFADRAYEEDGSLVSRSKPGAMITDEDEAIARTLSMVKDGCVRSITGKMIPVHADSVCLHGDQPKAVAFAHRIREALQREGVTVAPIREVLS